MSASKYTHKHEVCTVGQTKTLTTSGSSQRIALADDPSTGPRMYLLHCSEDVYLRQHGATAVAAGTSDFLLKADNYLKITVTSANDNYLSVIQVDTAGTLRITALSSETPGDGASGAATTL